ncbi:hypothetical protein [Sphingomonas sp.]|jgi:hypothetical protein|uniref:hypothetical protein n=1 Tax=Sphingomonas sp. TaxID=28214 RepID=UPI0035641635
MQHFEFSGGINVIAGQADAIPLAIGGLPSPESIFTIHCVTEILRRTRDRVKVIPFNTEEDCQRLTEATSNELTVPFFDTPDGQARKALLATQAPIIVITGNFAETAQFCMVARDLDALQAARFVSQSFSCLEPLLRLEHVRSIALDKAKNLAEWIDEVADWLGLQPSAWEATREEMLSDYAAWSTVEAAIHALVQYAHSAPVAAEPLPTAPQTLFEKLGISYHSGAIDKVFWPADCILEPGDPTFPSTDAIPLTGPSRMLTFGPFLHLPPGHWHARYQFEVDEHPAGNLMEFDVLNGSKILVSGRTLVESAGKFGFDCEFEIEESRLPVENRAILVEGSIGGLFKPIGIWLKRNN